MESKNIVISLAIMAFFATLFISKNQVIASGTIPTVKYISANNKSNQQILSHSIAKTEYSLDQKRIKIGESIQKQAKLDTLEKKIRIFVGDNINKFGMVYYDINSRKSIGINMDKQFVAASTIKIPINMLLYDMIEDKKIDIDGKLKYIKIDYEDGAGILQGMDLSKAISIKTLSDLSIIYSDNIAINMILRKIGKENRYNYIEKIVGHPIDHEGNNITPKDYFKILERLYSNPDNNKYYSGMIETMKKTEYNDRIDKYIPRGIVAHKIGDYGLYVNDTAIVYKNNPYIIVVFTKDIINANEVIAQVSKMIYDSQK